MIKKLEISEVNGINKPKFMTTFGNIVEKHPQAALFLLMHRPYMNTYDMLSTLEKFFDSLTITDKMKLLQQHPELATANIEGITKESLEEQKNAGLRSLTQESELSFSVLNLQYKKKFGFPFIICVHGNEPHRILQTLEKHLNSDLESEINRGIMEVKKISKLRLSSTIAE